MGKKCLCIISWLTRSQVHGKKMRVLASFSMSNRFLLVARHTLTMGLQKAGAVNFVNSLSLLSMKKVRTKTKNSQGT